HHDLAVHNDGLVVACWLKAKDFLWKAERHQDVQTFLLHHVSTDDAHIESFLDLVLERTDQAPEFIEVLVRAAEVYILILKPDALLGRLNQFQRVLRIVIWREQRLNGDLAVEPQWLEQARRFRKRDRLFRLLLGHEQIRRCEGDRLASLRSR